MEAGQATLERRRRRAPGWAAGLVPLAVLGLAIALFVGLGAPGLDRNGIPVEEVSVERTVLRPGEIELRVRNDGPDPVAIRQVTVNDSFVGFSQSDVKLGRLKGGAVRVTYPWVEGEAYEVGLVTATGGTIVHSIEVAAETPQSDLGFLGLMALIGVYVGIIPVGIGMLWLPWVRTVDARWIQFLMALTLGLLGFLAVDALLEGTEFAGQGAQAFGGAALVWLGAGIAYLTLSGIDGWLRGRRRGDWHSWSRSGSGCTTSAKGSRSAPHMRSARSRSARR